MRPVTLQSARCSAPQRYGGESGQVREKGSVHGKDYGDHGAEAGDRAKPIH